MQIVTIGFAKKNLREFVDRLTKSNVEKVVDVRLNNTSQLAGYSKRDDLEYVLSLVGIGYEHRPELAPTEEVLKNYKQKKISWQEYEKEFKKLLTLREPALDFSKYKGSICLLCSEDKPDQCHRRLVAEYIQSTNPEIKIVHL